MPGEKQHTFTVRETLMDAMTWIEVNWWTLTTSANRPGTRV